MRSIRCIAPVLAIFFLMLPAFASMNSITPLNDSPLEQARPLETASSPQNYELDEIVYIQDFENGLADWTYLDWLTVDFFLSSEAHWHQTDFAAPAGEGNNWRCSGDEYGADGGYFNHWFEELKTPAIDLTHTGSPVLSFDFKLECEGTAGATDPYDGWDGASVWIYYGEGEFAVLEPTTGTDYNATSLACFGQEYMMGPGIAGWGGSFDWSTVTVDLSNYTGYSNVVISFAFSADQGTSTPDDNSMTGFQVDNIAVLDGETVVFEDDGDTDPTEMTMSLGRTGEHPDLWDIVDDANAPSPTHAFGIEEHLLGYAEFYISPEVELPELEEGEELTADFALRSDFDHPTDDAAFYIFVIDVTEDTIHYGGNVYDISGHDYRFIGAPDDWGWFNENYSTPLIWDALAGHTVKMMIGFVSPLTEYTSTGFFIDDAKIELFSVEHDVETRNFLVPYPVTVGFPVPATCEFVNNGAFAESFNALWYLNETARLFTPSPPYNLGVGESIQVMTDNTNDPVDGWVPNEAGDVNLLVRHLLDGDEVTSNDEMEYDLEVLEENYFQFGYDDRSLESYINFGDNNTNVGPIIHFIPEDNHPWFAGATFDLQSIEYQWYANHWPENDVDYDIHVYGSGDAAPGAELWTTTETASWDPESSRLQATIFNVEEVEALQGLTGDFWVWIDLYTIGENNRAIPYPLASNPGTDDEHQFTYDGTTVSATGFDYFIHVIAYSVDYVDVEPQSGVAVPHEFALRAAYPNPFNPSTTISFDVAEQSNVKMMVYNVMGQRVATLVNQPMEQGSYNATFNASSLASGVYFVRMEAADFTGVQKIMLLK